MKPRHQQPTPLPSYLGRQPLLQFLTFSAKVIAFSFLGVVHIKLELNIMWYLCVFFHRLLEYRKAEFESLAGLFDGCSGATTLEWRLPEDHHPDSPFHFVNLPSEDMARNIANRSKYLYKHANNLLSVERIDF